MEGAGGIHWYGNFLSNSPFEWPNADSETSSGWCEGRIFKKVLAIIKVGRTPFGKDDPRDGDRIRCPEALQKVVRAGVFCDGKPRYTRVSKCG